MGEEVVNEPALSKASSRFLRQQVLLFQGFALALAASLGMTPEEAGRRFWEGLSSDGSSRTLEAPELERIARIVAEDMALIYGNASVERVGEGWRVTTTLGDHNRATLGTWGVSLEYVARWLGEVQRHEGERIGTTWTTNLHGDRLVQELTPPA